MDNWHLPMTILPGIGLLILSTSNLMITLSNEIASLIKEQSKEESIISRKLIQLKTLNRAMIFFYVAVAFLAITGVLGGLQIVSIKNSLVYVAVIGIVIMLSGIFSLIKYSFKAVSIRQDQFKTKFTKK
jgi:hypothetical protein